MKGWFRLRLLRHWHNFPLTKSDLDLKNGKQRVLMPSLILYEEYCVFHYRFSFM